jgi:hypothetical protein
MTNPILPAPSLRDALQQASDVLTMHHTDPEYRETRIQARFSIRRALAVPETNAEIELKDSDATIHRLAQILAGVAIALKGDELPLHRHGYHDLVELTQQNMLELELHRHLEAERKAASSKPLTDDAIREIMLANGFTVKPGETDLKPYVFAAAHAIAAAAIGAAK